MNIILEDKVLMNQKRLSQMGEAFFLKEANQLNSSEWKGITDQIEMMLEKLKFGSITLVVQDGKVVQIEKHEKVRLQSNQKR